ncbi:CHRD domain-containing protein [Streptomyces sp. NPDC059176]|uniref:CHRD domain-containing protein n=1 Tax=unclassified Streptomyces TaxID=2593676 RepID=UPI0036C2C72D
MPIQALRVMAMMVAAGATGGAPAPTLAHGAHDAPRTHVAHEDHAPGRGATTPTGAGASPVTGPATGDAVALTAELSVAHEVAVRGGPAVGDPDATAVAVVTVQGGRITFALRWKGFVPTSGHIHEGSPGRNGAVQVPLFDSAMPDGVHTAGGRAAVTDAELAERLRTRPTDFSVDLQSAEFPGGAVHGRLEPVTPLDAHRTAPLSTVQAPALRAISNGVQEVPKNDRSKVGDPDGRAVTLLRPEDTAVDYSLAWTNIQSPSKGHVHKGAFGTNGEVVIDLFNRPVPDGILAVSGRLEGLDAEAVRQLRNHPTQYYSNIHTAEFPDGAVRGQLFG